MLDLYTTPLGAITAFLFFSVLLFYVLGAKTARYKLLRDPEAKADGVGPLEGALLGLLALLLSFTFGMSAARYDARRALIVQESNDIGTVILRSDLYSDPARGQIRQDLQEYVEKRIAYYEAGEKAGSDQARSEAEGISSRIWQRAMRLSKESPNLIRDAQMIPALNAMIDVVASRDAARHATIPGLIVFLLIALTLLGSFIVGYSKKTRGHDWIVVFLYSVMTVMTIHTILDLDRPRRGLIQTDGPHEKIVSLRQHFPPRP